MGCIAGVLNGKIEYEFHPQEWSEHDEISGILSFSHPIHPESFVPPSFVEEYEPNWDAGKVYLRIGKGEDSTKGSFELLIKGNTYHIPFLSAPALNVVRLTRSDQTDPAESLFREHYQGARKDWDFRNDCRDTLRFECFVDTIDGLARETGPLGYVQFRSGIGYFAKRILENSPQGIYSFETLQNRIEYWNQTENLKHINAPEVIGEKLGRNWYRSDFGNERTDLIEIGFPHTDYDPVWESVAPACWIAHIIHTEGLGHVREHIKQRPPASDDSYSSLKESAMEADFGERGKAWGRVVSKAGAQNEHELRFTVSNYLDRTAEEYRGKAKFQPMLYAAITAIIPDSVPSHVKQKALANEQISIGHNWRRDGALERAAEAFERGLEIARGELNRGHSHLPNQMVESTASLAHVEAKMISGTDRWEKKRMRYQEGLQEVRKIDNKLNVHPGVLENEFEFLKDMLERLPE